MSTTLQVDRRSALRALACGVVGLAATGARLSNASGKRKPGRARQNRLAAEAILPGLFPTIGTPVRLPIVSHTQEEAVATGRMKTTATLNRVRQAGRLDRYEISATTRTWTTNSLFGFTGGVSVIFSDASGTMLYATPAKKYGVDSPNVGDNDRTERWSASIPAGVVAQAAKLHIDHTHTPTNRAWNGFVQALELAIKAAKAYCEYRRSQGKPCLPGKSMPGPQPVPGLQPGPGPQPVSDPRAAGASKRRGRRRKRRRARG